MLWASVHCVGAEKSRHSCKTGESGERASQRAQATLQSQSIPFMSHLFQESPLPIVHHFAVMPLLKLSIV